MNYTVKAEQKHLISHHSNITTKSQFNIGLINNEGPKMLSAELSFNPSLLTSSD